MSFLGRGGDKLFFLPERFFFFSLSILFRPTLLILGSCQPNFIIEGRATKSFQLALYTGLDVSGKYVRVRGRNIIWYTVSKTFSRRSAVKRGHPRRDREGRWEWWDLRCRYPSRHWTGRRTGYTWTEYNLFLAAGHSACLICLHSADLLHWWNC